MKNSTANHQGNCLTKCHLLVDLFIVVLLIGTLVSMNSLVRPRHQGFFCEDASIRYPYLQNTISNDVIVSVTIAAPVIVMLLTETFNLSSGPRRHSGRVRVLVRGGTLAQWTAVGAFLTYFWGYLVLTLLVIVLKVTSGNLRPHFLAVCRPDINLETCRGYISVYNCTNLQVGDKVLNAARQSFPSGHAAYAAYMALFLVLYVEARLKTRHCQLLKLTSHAVLTLYVMWCSATRVSDHMHHVSDVMVGQVMGVAMALVAFLRVTVSGGVATHSQPCRDIETGDTPLIIRHDNNSDNKVPTTDSANGQGSSGDVMVPDDNGDDAGRLKKGEERETAATASSLLLSSNPQPKVTFLTLEGSRHSVYP